jgi:hypothetical protein
MKRYYDEHRRTFIGTFVFYQLVTSAVALVIGTWGWNPGSVARVLILLMLVLALALNGRRWDWVSALSILALLIFRLTTQVA